MNRLLILTYFIFAIACKPTPKEHTFYYDSGELQSRYFTLNGEKHGPSTSYYKDGNLHSEKYWNYGDLTGQEKIFSQSGAVVTITNIEHGKTIDITNFDDQGQVVSYLIDNRFDSVTYFKDVYVIAYSSRQLETNKNQYVLDSSITFYNDSTIMEKFIFSNMENYDGERKVPMAEYLNAMKKLTSE